MPKIIKSLIFLNLTGSENVFEIAIKYMRAFKNNEFENYLLPFSE